ncbi:MAG: tetratricopeptide repeat protein [Elusimicrobia bacterium]|nr:tetratricopeptide repeat protein [Elusimicrobiota bacterium]
MANPKNRQQGRPAASAAGSGLAELFAHKVVVWWLPLLYFFISSAFYLRTYDSAQVKITLMQMGGLALATFWIVRLMEAGKSAFNKDDVVCLSPFLAYLLVGVFSFLHAPYHMASVDFFLRHAFFMIAALIAIYELESAAVDRLTRILILAAWVAVGYGFFQLLDTNFFPSGVGKGIDPFIWRGAFGSRVFSTYGNPNFFADFLVIMFPILLMQYFKTKNLSLVLLMGLLLVDLVATGTKGAWLGFAMVSALFGVIAFVYFPKVTAPYRKIVLAAVLLGTLGFGGFVARDLRTRMVSINFRLFTWEATWEMIRTQPILGTGVGSFPPIYPAFRRPPIFHIEGKHNTETDHSENEYIEQLFDNGILGFGVFIWLVLSSLVVGFRALGQLTTSLAQKDGRPHPRAYDLIGYMVAFMGMLGHNCFDVSLRFVSSGVYLGLLSGMIVNLSRGKALYELHTASSAAAAGGAPPGDDKASEPGSGHLLSEFLIWPSRIAAWGALAYAVWLVFREFSGLQGPLSQLRMGGEVLQWWISWAAFAGCVLSVGFILARQAYLSERPWVPLVILAMLFPMRIFWGYFKADVHHNIAIYFSKERMWDRALEHYRTVTDLNPNFVMAHYFRGNVFNDRFDMRKLYNEAWGDRNNAPRDDYERALEAYDGVRRLAPNYVQHHHQVGVLHLKMAEEMMKTGRPQEAEKYLDRAMTRFKLYEAIDPVFPPNFFRMGQIHMIRKDHAAAIKAYEAAIDAEQCAVAPSLLANETLRTTILSYQPYTQLPGEKNPKHLHESPEAYMNLGNAYFMMEKWPEAERVYKRALALNPRDESVRRNLGILYQRANAVGRLKTLPPPLEPAAAVKEGFTGFEIVQPRQEQGQRPAVVPR